MFRSRTSIVSALSGGVANRTQTLRSLTALPLLKPDMRISLIRLSCELHRKAHAGGQSRSNFALKQSIYLESVHLIRSGTIVQAVHLPSDSACSQQGPFAPRALPRISARTGLSDSRSSPQRVIDSPLKLVQTADHRNGSPEVPRCVFPRALSPLTPRCLTGAYTRFFPVSGRLQHFREVGHTHWCNEAETGSLSLGLTRSQSGGITSFASHPFGGNRPASHDRLPSHRGPPLLGERVITKVNTFQLTRRTRLILAHRRTRRFRAG